MFLAIIFFVTDPKKLLLVLQKTNLIYLIPVFFLCLLLVGLKAKRWQLLANRLDIKYSFARSFSIYSIGVFWSLITPGKLGEAIKIFYLKKDGYPIKKSLITTIVDRLADFGFLIFLIFISCLLFSQYLDQNILWLTLIILLAIIFAIIFIKKEIYLKIIKLVLPKKYQPLIAENAKNLLTDFGQYNFLDYLASIGLTAGSWLVYIFQVYLLGLALNLKLNFMILVPMIAIANAADLLPISFNGVGTREAVFIFFFSIVNLPAEKAVALGIIQLFIVLASAFIGFLFWLKEPINFKKINNE